MYALCVTVCCAMPLYVVHTEYISVTYELIYFTSTSYVNRLCKNAKRVNGNSQHRALQILGFYLMPFNYLLRHLCRPQNYLSCFQKALQLECVQPTHSFTQLVALYSAPHSDLTTLLSSRLSSTTIHSLRLHIYIS